jgi:hypothetical protein
MKLNFRLGILFVVLSLISFVFVVLIAEGNFGYDSNGNLNGSLYLKGGKGIGLTIILLISGIIMIVKNRNYKNHIEEEVTENKVEVPILDPMFEKVFEQPKNMEQTELEVEKSVGDYLIESGSDLKSVLNTTMLFFIIELFFGLVSFDAITKPSSNNGSIGVLLLLVSFIALCFGIYVIYKLYSGYNNLIKAGEKMNSEKL